jgi:hypothetical protein
MTEQSVLLPEQQDQAGEELQYAQSALKLGELAERARFEDDIEDIFSHGIASDDDPGEALRNLMSMLDKYFDDNDTSFYLIGLVAYGEGQFEDGNALEAITNPRLRDRIRGVVRRLAGLYGSVVSNGVEVFNRGSHDWEYCEVRTLNDLDKNVIKISVNLRTLGRDVLELESSPLSILRLVNRLLPAIYGAMSATDESAFDEQAVDSFTELASALIAAMREQAPAPAEDGDSAVHFVVEVEGSDASAVAADVNAAGAVAELKYDGTAEVLPLLVPLLIAIPPGLGILATVVNRIVHSWKDHGAVIDARGDGPPAVARSNDLPHGTVVILTRDGDRSERTDLPDEKLSDYIAAALTALSGGASATASAGAANAAVSA